MISSSEKTDLHKKEVAMEMIVLTLVIVILITLISEYTLSNNYVSRVVYEKDSTEYAFFSLSRFRQLGFGGNNVAWVLDEVRWNASSPLLVYGELWILTKINLGLENHLKKYIEVTN